MPESGLFITLYDEETLQLYLENGIFGQHMSPTSKGEDPHYTHYRALGDYGCARDGKHVFFFRDRKIYYGGQIQGSDQHGAFYLNGQNSPLGREADAPLVWDESQRECYDGIDGDETGLFTVDDEDKQEDAVCQPFLLQFEDHLDLAGSYISSDELYFRLGEYPYPLPSNAMMGMTFCTLTPAETRITLSLLQDTDKRLDPTTKEDIQLKADPVPFSPEHGIDHVKEAHPESHLESSVLSDPSLLPKALQPEDDTALCRQVPISPFKPRNIDQADVCYFNEEEIKDGTIPNTVIELKNSKAGKSASLQVVKYVRWLHKRLEEDAEGISVYVFAPAFTSNFESHIPPEHQDQIELVKFDGSRQTTL